MTKFWDDLESRRAEVERVKENSARLAEATALFSTGGQGSIEFAHRVDFGLTFIDKPMVQYGSEVDLDELDRRLDTDSGKSKCPPLPLTAGFVSDWDTDTRGFYVGAWVAARVYYPPEDLVPIDFEIQIFHHFRFSAVAMKDVPLDLD